VFTEFPVDRRHPRSRGSFAEWIFPRTLQEQYSREQEQAPRFLRVEAGCDVRASSPGKTDSSQGEAKRKTEKERVLAVNARRGFRTLAFTASAIEDRHKS